MAPEAAGESRRYAHRPDVQPTAACLWESVSRAVEREQTRLGRVPRVVDLGCGAGHLVTALVRRGVDVVGIEPSDSGIAAFRASGREGCLVQASADESLAARMGRFDVFVSTEVIEHVYEPRRYAACMHALLEPGGLAVVTTPYHGYWKNLLILVTGGWDSHFTALWDYGHIKFWSRRTLTTLLAEQELRVERFERVGRMLPALAKSMVLYAWRESTHRER